MATCDDRLRVQVQVNVDVAAFYRLGLALMQLYATFPFPGHDEARSQ